MKSVQAEELQDSANRSDMEEEEEEEEEEDTDESEGDDIQGSQVDIAGGEHNESEAQEGNDTQNLSTVDASCSLIGPSSDEHNLSHPFSRPGSRISQMSKSPPASRSPSPDTLAKMAASLSLQSAAMRDRVASDLAKHSRQQRKYHTKRGAQRAGRPQGSKAKQDTRVKLDKSGIWE